MGWTALLKAMAPVVLDCPQSKCRKHMEKMLGLDQILSTPKDYKA